MEDVLEAVGLIGETAVLAENMGGIRATEGGRSEQEKLASLGIRLSKCGDHEGRDTLALL
jgi:hypothetical protein